MLISDIIARIEDFAPLANQAAWDKSGIQVASEAIKTETMAVFLDPLPHVIEKAIDSGAGFLLSHHPLSLKPDLPAKKDNFFFSLRTLLRADACLYAAHTSLDVVSTGPAGWLGRSLDLENIRVLEPLSGKADSSLGYGGVGDFAFPMPLSSVLEEILKLASLDEAFLCGPVRHKEISRVAWCGGSGASLIEAASAKGAQLFVTGDVKHHAALDAALPVLDVGHHAFEEEMMRRFASLLRESLPDINVVFIPSVSPFVKIRSGE